MPEKEVSVRQQVVIEVLNDVAFRQNVEVDQNVAAENYIHAFMNAMRASSRRLRRVNVMPLFNLDVTRN